MGAPTNPALGDRYTRQSHYGYWIVYELRRCDFARYNVWVAFGHAKTAQDAQKMVAKEMEVLTSR